MTGSLQPAIILGGGGHARVLAECLQLDGQPILGFTAPAPRQAVAPGVDWLGDDAIITGHDPDGIVLVNGLGAIGNAGDIGGSTGKRRQLFLTWSGKSYRFPVVRHPSATISTLDVVLGQGCQLLAGSLLGPGVRLGDNVLINSRALVEHGCQVGSHSHIATGAILCGDCDIGEQVHIGAGAVVIQGISIGTGAIIAAGAVVTENVEPLTLVAGVPARRKRALGQETLEEHHP